MAQIIKTVVERDDFIDADQVSQILYIDVHQGVREVIEINYHRQNEYVVVKYKDEFFKLHSPDISDLTIHQVIDYLECNQGQIIVSWVENGGNINNVLNMGISEVGLNQIEIIV